jgi:L-fucose isomerase-like protein
MGELRWRALASPLHDHRAVRALAAPWRAVLAAAGAAELPEDSAELPEALLLLTGGTEAQALSLHRRRPSRALLLLAHGAHNSLPAALETLAALRQRGAPAALVLLDGPGDPAAELAWGLRAVAAQRSLARSRIGLVGGASDWLVASSPAPETVLRAWGPMVSRIPMGPFHAELPMHADSDAIQRALEERVNALRLDAVTLRCFDLLQARDTTACLALARLGAAGLPAGCEGDLVSTLALLWVQRLVGAVPWMANPARLEGRGLWLAHCTVPLHLVAEHRIDTHFESGRGVGVAGRFEPGPVTLLRIGGAQLERLWCVDTSLLEAGEAPDQCRTQALVALDDAARRELLERPLGNHIVLAPGHHADDLRRYHRTLGPGRRW